MTNSAMSLIKILKEKKIKFSLLQEIEEEGFEWKIYKNCDKKD